MKGPAIFLAQFADDSAPFNSLQSMAEWAAGLGYLGIQIPTWDDRLFDLEKAASSRTYCDEVVGICADAGVVITELSTHLQGQLVAVHPAYGELFDGFAPASVHGKNKERTAWAMQQLRMAAKASGHLGLTAHATFSGALLWHTAYPWPQRPAGLVEAGFAELASRWRPLLDAFDEAGCDVCYELHPGEDLHDGVTFERFLDSVDQHPRANILYDPSHFVLQQLDYLQFIDFYHERIKAFHVKDAEFVPSGKAGVYGGYLDWKDRPGRFRSLGDGTVNFRRIFSSFVRYGYAGWAVLEWECCLKHPEQGAQEGAPFIADHMIRTTDKAFDDFAGGESDAGRNQRLLGLES
ncbi:MAG: sugar phosphate isomerase/epimerase family protein [Gammaproteobacteria bacterium]